MYSKKLGRFTMTFDKKMLNRVIHNKLGDENNNFLEINDIDEYQYLLKNFTKHNAELLINKFNKYVLTLEDILYKETEKTNMNSPLVQRVNSYEENGIEVEGKRIFQHKTDPNKRIVTVPKLTSNKKFYIHDKSSSKSKSSPKSSPSSKRSKGRKKDGKRNSRKKIFK